MKAAALLAALALAACSGANGPAGSTPGSQPTPSPVPIMVKSQGNPNAGVTFGLQRDGRRVYSIVARANVSKSVGEGSGVSVFAAPRVTFFDKDGTRLYADSPSATVHEEDRTVVMNGGVKARTSSGIELTCETLTYDDRTARIRGEGDVVMTTPRGERLEGQRIDADTRLSEVLVTGAPPARPSASAAQGPGRHG